MTEIQVGAAAARAGAQVAGRLVQAAASPLVMVRHGQREDRAAVYDRFVQACAACGRDRDGSGIEAVWAVWEAINLRCRPEVRAAAEVLAGQVMATADPNGAGRFYRDLFSLEDTGLPPDDPFQPKWRVTGPKHTTDEEMMLALWRFVEEARADLNRRWWHALLTPRVRRWWLSRL